jgi:hypothetical protein
MSILVVDDCADVADALAAMLQLQGHKVHSAYDAQSALSIAASEKPECVLVDVNMPVMDGPELAQRLRQAHGANIVIIGITGDAAIDIATDPRLAVMDHCLAKPVEARQLDLILRRIGS